MTKLATLPPVKTAKLPVVYEHAKDALLKCSTIDECAEWKNKAEAIASYARQADDETLLNTATKIKARAIRRCGELLKAIEPAKGGDRGGGRPSASGKPKGGRVPIGSRTSVGGAAGLSPHQTKQALRVASIDHDEFEAAVETDKPATVKELAKRGTKPSTAHLQGRDPEDYRAATEAQGALEHFIAEATNHDPKIVVRGTVPSEYQEMKANARAAIAWLEKLLAELERGKRS